MYGQERGRGRGGRSRGLAGQRFGIFDRETEIVARSSERENSINRRGETRNKRRGNGESNYPSRGRGNAESNYPSRGRENGESNYPGRGRGNGESNYPNRGRGAYSGPVGRSAERNISYHLLKLWSENADGDELLIHISNKLEMLEKEFTKGTLKPDWYTLLVKSFTNVLNCQHQPQKLKRILSMISRSNFLNVLLTNYLDQKQYEGSNWVQAGEFFISVIDIVKQMMKYLPDQTQRCKLTMQILHSTALEMGSILKTDIQQLIASTLSTLSEAQKVRIEKEVAKQSASTRFGLPTADNETPPDNFKDLSIIPTVQDLFEKEKPFLRAIIAKGVYKDQQHYLDVQFRLTREDFYKPLRAGIQEFRDHGGKNNFIPSDIRIYSDVHFTGMTIVNGISHVVQFDIKKLKNVKWDHSKRLLTGNLLCLSNDNFKKTLIFATVSFRKTDLLKKGMLNITCHSGLDVVLKATSNETFLMAETMAYYEAVNPILKGLQNIDSDLPLKDYIISCKKVLKPPVYLLGSVRKYDISSLMKPKQLTQVSALNTLSWPKAEDMCLNSSQRDAAILALTKEFSVIQGPPGTGKTYVGLKVMEVLLNNQQERALNEYGEEYDPILVICYTNHALDQFLEGILQFCHDGIIRVGGKSSSTLLEPFNLRNVKRRLQSSQSGAFKYSITKLYRTMDDFSSDIKEVRKLLENVSNNILSELTLVDCISPEHYQDLVQGPEFSFGGKKKTSKILQWLNASGSSFIEDLPSMIKHHLMKVVMKCIKLSPKLKSYEFKIKGTIVERVTIYGFWLLEYRSVLRNRVSVMQIDPITANRFISTSFVQHILPDKDILSVVPPNLYHQIKISLEGFDIESTGGTNFIEVWVLGLNQSCKKQLDDYERLLSYLEKAEANKETDLEDDFDDDEEVEISKSRRLLYDDDNEEKNIFEATMKLENEDEFLMNRAKFLGITEIEDDENEQNVNEDGDGFKTVTRRKHVSFAKMIKIFSDETYLPLPEEEEDSIHDLWALDMKTKLALYKLWLKKYKHTLVEKIEDLLKQYSDTKEELQETRMKEDKDVLRQAKVIGMTTTGAAKHHTLLEAIGCRIIIVEEAAEVLESHIVTSLNQNCKHLILIGDHQQLRPNPTVYEHAKNFNLDISLFERMVNNEIPHVTLKEQHRMRESISVVMRHIYPNLRDHESVKKYENIQGVSKNIFFIEHCNQESSVSDTLSKSNLFEAEYLICLCKYFFLQGYKPSQITILATYAGQVLELKKQMKQQALQHGVRVTAVDNFQGEENDIILLSLVRSNERRNVGFLKVDNRVCVALSRAKKGFFAIGNFELLSNESKLWAKIKQTAIEEKFIGDGLPVACPNHPDEKRVMRLPSDFGTRPQGGCNKPCDFRLNCGHICQLLCHGFDLLHENIPCKAPCSKTCSEGHPCRKQCREECGKCTFLVNKVISACGHTNKIACHVDPKDTDCTGHCDHYLECGHQCKGKCGRCKKTNAHLKCEVIVTYFWPCDHEVKVPCYMAPDKYPCPKKCDHLLDCGHNCKGKCSDCLNGAVHVACTEKCGKMMPCGHKCQSFCGVICPPCTFPCASMCFHGPCSHKNKPRQCGEPCVPCQEKCTILQKCVHKKCNRMCSDICEEERCDQLCMKSVKPCGHKCASLCGETCVCKFCEDVYEIGLTGCSVKGKDKLKAEKSENEAKKDELVKENSSRKLGPEESMTFQKPDPMGTSTVPNKEMISDVGDQGKHSVSHLLENAEKNQGIVKASPENAMPNINQQDIVLIKLPVCRHVFALNEIEQYVSKSVQNSTTEIISCPVCNAPIQMSCHFDNTMKKQSIARELKKKEVYESNTIKQIQNMMIFKSLKELQDKDQNMVWFDWRHLENEKVQSLSEFEAIACKIKFAFVINEIQSLEKLTFTNIDKQLDERAAVLLKLKKHMSHQQINEYRQDLRRLFIIKYAKVLEYFSSNHGIKQFDRERKNNVLEQLKATQPTLEVINKGIQLVRDMEIAVEDDCKDSSVQAVFVIKKRISRRILTVLKAENITMLSEILNVATPSSFASGSNLFSSKGARASSQSTSKSVSRLRLSSAEKSSLLLAKSSAARPSSASRLLSAIQPSKTKTLSSAAPPSAAKTGETKAEVQSRLSQIFGKLGI